MGYIDKNLLPDEKVMYRTKKHFIIFLVPLLMTGFALYIYTLDNPILLRIAWILDLAALLSWANAGLIYVTSEFAVTNKRVMMKEGFFFRHANETRLGAIAQVGIVQSLLGQLLNYGNVGINGFGGGVDVFSQIASPFAFQKSVQTELNKLI